MPEPCPERDLRKQGGRGSFFRKGGAGMVHIGFQIKKEVRLVVELDQVKYTLGTYDKPLIEVGDSL